MNRTDIIREVSASYHLTTDLDLTDALRLIDEIFTNFESDGNTLAEIKDILESEDGHDEEVNDLYKIIDGKTWEDLPRDFYRSAYPSPFLMDFDLLMYYLPGFLVEGVATGDSHIIDSLIGCLFSFKAKPRYRCTPNGHFSSNTDHLRTVRKVIQHLQMVNEKRKKAVLEVLDDILE